VDAVVHAAAVVDPALAAQEDLVMRVNRDSAVALGELARAARVRRFVFVSSIAAMGFWSGTATSESACRPVTTYGKAKLEAERRLLELAAPDFDVIVLRLPTVYGPGERYNFLAWASAVDRGVFRLIGNGRNVMPLCTTRNAARAARGAVVGLLPSGVYLVADAEQYSVARIHRALCSALGKRTPRLRLPRTVAFVAGALNQAAAARIPSVPLLLTPARVRTLTVNQPFDVRPLLRAGIELDAPLEEWVGLTVAEYRRS
jgi:UDP-glucose 4-epimerase